MAHLATQSVAGDGAAVAFGAATGGGDTVDRGDLSFLIVRNGGGGAITVTIDTPGTTHGLAIADEGVAVAAGATTIIPLNDEIFVHPDDGLIHLAYSGVVTVTVAVCSL